MESSLVPAATAASASSQVTQSGVQRLGEILVRPGVYWLFHSWRLFGYGFLLPPLMALRPKQTLLALAAYATIHRKRWWQVGVHRFLGYGASRRHKIMNPSKHLISQDKRYLWCLHPHSVLADGWHSVIARNTDSFDTGPPEIGRKIALCFAPIIQHVPVHQEMYRDKCGDADKKSITKWWSTPDTDPALIPGGFAESIFANSAERQYEYAYIKDRKGFIRIAIEAGKDIVPCYTFRATWMYHNPGVMRGWRARFSQNYYLGLVLPIGRFGTSMPLTDDTTTVIFPPFETSRYKLTELDQAHQEYMNHLKKYFDEYKGKCGMEGVELRFIGKEFRDDDILSRTINAFQKMGMRSRL